MLFTIQGNNKPSRLVAIAYDISCQRRARRIRRVLDSVHHAKQYSVYEAILTNGDFKGLLAELSIICDFEQDSLASWWPLDGLRLHYEKNQLMVCANFGQPCNEIADLPKNIGNFILCYDISDPDSLNAIAGKIAPETTAIQRSVYWLRGSTQRVTTLLQYCTAHLDEGDRLWAYPLRGVHELWHIGTSEQAILPISTHRWSK